MAGIGFYAYTVLEAAGSVPSYIGGLKRPDQDTGAVWVFRRLAGMRVTGRLPTARPIHAPNFANYSNAVTDDMSRWLV